MAGQFNKAARAILPGSYFNWYVSDSVDMPAPLGGTVAIVGQHNTGPIAQPIALSNFGEYEAVFGKGLTDLRRAVFHAFLGRGLPGKGGAAEVIVLRQAGASAAAATATLQNATPAVGLTLTARYKGTDVHRFTWRVQPSQEAGFSELGMFDGTRLVEEFIYPSTDIDALAASVTTTSGYFTAVANVTGVALAAVSAAPTAGGNDGSTVTSGDWSASLASLEYEPFALFAPANLTDPTIHTLIRAWVISARTRGKRMLAVLGGAAGETFVAHGTRTAGYNDPDILSFGTGSILDETQDPTGTGIQETISTAQGVARVAGDIASRGNGLDLVNSRYVGWMVTGGATLSQAETAARTGRTLLTRDGHPAAPCRINLGVTSWTNDTDEKPFRIYSNVKFVRTMHIFETEVTQAQEYGEFIGELGVTDKTVELIIGDITTRLKRMEETQVIQPGWTIEQDLDPAPTPQDDFVQVKYSMAFVRGLRAIYNSVTVS